MSDLAELEERNEEMSTKVSIEEKRALIKEAKRRYGPDWKKFFSTIRSGIDWQAVKFRIK